MVFALYRPIRCMPAGVSSRMIRSRRASTSALQQVSFRKWKRPLPIIQRKILSVMTRL